MMVLPFLNYKSLTWLCVNLEIKKIQDGRCNTEIHRLKTLKLNTFGKNPNRFKTLFATVRELSGLKLPSYYPSQNY